jgi:hypothetical protein
MTALIALDIVLKVMFPSRTKPIDLPSNWCDKFAYCKIMKHLNVHSHALVAYISVDLRVFLRTKQMSVNGQQGRNSSKKWEILPMNSVSNIALWPPNECDLIALVEVLGQRVLKNNQKHIDEFGKFT